MTGESVILLELPPKMQTLANLLETDMGDKVIVVTGANSGIGKATASDLARMGATVIMVTRDEQRGEDARSQIQRETESKSLDLRIADLSSFASIHDFAEQFQANYTKLDALVNNAGLYNLRKHVTADGNESTFAVNYLAPFLLTHLVLGQLKKTAPSRIVNVSSVGHYTGHIDFDDLNMENGYNGWRAYKQSKLALVLFTHELSKRFRGTGVTANSVHPGTVATNIWSRPFGPAGFIMSVPKIFMKSAKDGAKTVVYLASSPEVTNVNGEYWDDLKVKQSSDESYDEGVSRRLWDESLRLTRIQSYGASA